LKDSAATSSSKTPHREKFKTQAILYASAETRIAHK